MLRNLLPFLITFVALAQYPGEPFTLIRLIRKPSVPAVDLSVIDAHRAARTAVDVVGLKSITGQHQVWLIEAHGSFASVEAVDRALASSPGTSAAGPDEAFAPATLIGLLRPGLSYRPDEAIKALPAARFFQIAIFRSRPGTSMDFAEVMRIRNAALDRVNVDRPELGYQILSGTTSGTYVFLAPMQSLKSLDESMARIWAYGDGSSRQATSKITAEADITREQFLFRVDPRISYVSESFAAVAPEFWHGKR
jgi:hypothetical protein